MPVDSTRPHRFSQPRWDETERRIAYRAEPPADRARVYVVAVLLSMILVVLCVLAFVLGSAILSDSERGDVTGPVAQTPELDPSRPVPSPSRSGGGSTQSQVSVQPTQGYIGTLVTVNGQGWWPGEPVFVFLRSASEAQGAGYAYAAAVADDQGRFETALTFPNEVRWIGARWADVTARGSRSGLEASTRFTLIAPTPTASSTAVPAAMPSATVPSRSPTATPVPTWTPLPSVTAPPPVITDWRGEYFDNPVLGGDPVLVRNDTAIDFVWGRSSPAAGVPADGFSVRWSRQQPFRDGTYRFVVGMDDGARFWIDGQLVVDDWQNGPFRPHTFELDLSEGEHALVLEYYEDLGDAEIQLEWERMEPPTATPTPSVTPSPTATPTPTEPPPASEPWRGRYYGNPELRGEPVMRRDDAELNFAWGAGSPGEAIPADEFSARWTRDLWLPAGTHRFLLTVDDGARVWVDGELVIDAWQIATGETYSADVDLPEGVHRIVVEYFEAFLDAGVHLWVEGP